MSFKQSTSRKWSQWTCLPPAQQGMTRVTQQPLLGQQPSSYHSQAAAVCFKTFVDLQQPTCLACVHPSGHLRLHADKWWVVGMDHTALPHSNSATRSSWAPPAQPSLTSTCWPPSPDCLSQCKAALNLPRRLHLLLTPCSPTCWQIVLSSRAVPLVVSHMHLDASAMQMKFFCH